MILDLATSRSLIELYGIKVSRDRSVALMIRCSNMHSLLPICDSESDNEGNTVGISHLL